MSGDDRDRPAETAASRAERLAADFFSDPPPRPEPTTETGFVLPSGPTHWEGDAASPGWAAEDPPEPMRVKLAAGVAFLVAMITGLLVVAEWPQSARHVYPFGLMALCGVSGIQFLSLLQRHPSGWYLLSSAGPAVLIADLWSRRSPTYDSDDAFIVSALLVTPVVLLSLSFLDASTRRLYRVTGRVAPLMPTLIVIGILLWLAVTSS